MHFFELPKWPIGRRFCFLALETELDSGVYHISNCHMSPSTRYRCNIAPCDVSRVDGLRTTRHH